MFHCQRQSLPNLSSPILSIESLCHVHLFLCPSARCASILTRSPGIFISWIFEYRWKSILKEIVRIFESAERSPWKTHQDVTFQPIWYSNTHIAVLSVAYVLANQHPWISEGLNERNENSREILRSKSPKSSRVTRTRLIPDAATWIWIINDIHSWRMGRGSFYCQIVTLHKMSAQTEW